MKLKGINYFGFENGQTSFDGLWAGPTALSLGASLPPSRSVCAVAKCLEFTVPISCSVLSPAVLRALACGLRQQTQGAPYATRLATTSTRGQGAVLASADLTGVLTRMKLLGFNAIPDAVQHEGPVQRGA